MPLCLHALISVYFSVSILYLFMPLFFLQLSLHEFVSSYNYLIMPLCVHALTSSCHLFMPPLLTFIRFSLCVSILLPLHTFVCPYSYLFMPPLHAFVSLYSYLFMPLCLHTLTPSCLCVSIHLPVHAFVSPYSYLFVPLCLHTLTSSCSRTCITLHQWVEMESDDVCVALHGRR